MSYIFELLTYVGYFLLWTFVIYWVHRLAHMFKIPIVTKMHWDHHKQVNAHAIKGWHWSNFFLFNDTWRSTADLWLTEVIPTLLFCWLTGQWWLFALYYLWAALIQEAIEHNPKFNFYPWLTSGKWHLIHHSDAKKNYGVFFPIWDIIFKTSSRLKEPRS